MSRDSTERGPCHHEAEHPSRRATALEPPNEPEERGILRRVREGAVEIRGGLRHVAALACLLAAPRENRDELRPMRSAVGIGIREKRVELGDVVRNAEPFELHLKSIEQRLRSPDNTDLERMFTELAQQLVALARAAAPHLNAADRAKRELEAVESEQAHALDPASLRALREQLTQNEFSVLGTFKALAPALRAALDDAAFRRLETAVGALDFKAALKAAKGK